LAVTNWQNISLIGSGRWLTYSRDLIGFAPSSDWLVRTPLISLILCEEVEEEGEEGTKLNPKP
jgi:hypothetical protein